MDCGRAVEDSCKLIKIVTGCLNDALDLSGAEIAWKQILPSMPEDAEANILLLPPSSAASFPSLPPTVVSFLLLGRLCSRDTSLRES